MARLRPAAITVLSGIVGTLAIAGLTAVGCGGDDSTGGSPDATPDQSTTDTGAKDSGTTPLDSGTPKDTGTADTGTADSGLHDSGTDTGIADSAPRDTGTDTGVADTGTDTGVADTGTADSGDAGDAGGDSGDAGDGGVCNPNWPDGGTNLITNPDFESGGTGWSTPFGGTFSVSTATAECGTQSGEVSGRTQQYQSLQTPFTNVPGTYNVAVWVLQDGAGDAGANGIATGGICNPGDGGASTFPVGPQMASVPPNTWVELTGTLTIPAGCATVNFFVGAPAAAVAPFPDIFADEVFVGQ